MLTEIYIFFVVVFSLSCSARQECATAGNEGQGRSKKVFSAPLSIVSKALLFWVLMLDLIFQAQRARERERGGEGYRLSSFFSSLKAFFVSAWICPCGGGERERVVIGYYQMKRGKKPAAVDRRKL